eukprot:CAMPEP_0201283178 /NCGR_PEP_ID=MMETSP1317-20130820/7842_1 /ASSEMBLY_ACC=CAM_ASM_000770 /TAXON_ID=187299 /ORGANISM="Undescribed Undescribed, Strain Undescribed" /LENGTH=54 /DNA_ID=CAMNT_0047598529 /DNA_START=483 /DNA_END=647 /DNA_ORIENTATION=+
MDIAKGIKFNSKLISLNLNSCGLDDRCGAALVDAMEHNHNIIHFDFGGNKLSLE